MAYACHKACKNHRGDACFWRLEGSLSTHTQTRTMQLTMWALRPPTEAQSHELYCWGAEAANVWLAARGGEEEEGLFRVKSYEGGWKQEVAKEEEQEEEEEEEEVLAFFLVNKEERVLLMEP